MKTDEKKPLQTHRNKQLYSNESSTEASRRSRGKRDYCVAKFVVQRECNANKYFREIFFSNDLRGKSCVGTVIYSRRMRENDNSRND